MSDSTLDQRKAEQAARVARWAERLAATKLTPGQADGLACVACGQDYLSRSWTGGAVPIGFRPGGGQVFVCKDCDEELIATTPTEAEAAVVAQLHVIARQLESQGAASRVVTQLRRTIRGLGYEVRDLEDPDTMRAAATMLTAYAPGVNDTARETGDRLLRVVGDQR